MSPVTGRLALPLSSVTMGTGQVSLIVFASREPMTAAKPHRHHRDRTRYDTLPGIAWKTISEGVSLRVPASNTSFSLVAISVLPVLVQRVFGGDRLIALSSSSAHFKTQSPAPRERDQAQALRRAEKAVQRHCLDKGIAWTIFRPTLVYDPSRDRNVSAIAAFVQRFGVFPIVWPGTGRRQPIHADDVARALSVAARIPETCGMQFDFPGGETLTYREMVRRVIESSGKRAFPVYLPLGLARAAFRVWRTVTDSQYSIASLERMSMDLILDPAPVRKVLGFDYRPFRPEFPRFPSSRRSIRPRPKQAR